MGQKIESEKLLNHLKEKWQGRPCPMCGVGNWNVSDTIFELREFNQGNLVMGGGPIFPVIPVTCDNCGNSVFINAIVTKLVEQNKK
ncbi:hypothetical protein [Aquirufa rosea]|uniref:Uncharacterized protein n=1 Tax=Aquirufa rosea TaxID=2509241 RepID=A0A4Q1BZB6_9BACT|nr:hypothetical protein [Aquirufa rosea]RXK48849.1 hypothetical protein ESB04_07805 [Aquirufa rosea]